MTTTEAHAATVAIATVAGHATDPPKGRAPLIDVVNAVGIGIVIIAPDATTQGTAAETG